MRALAPVAALIGDNPQRPELATPTIRETSCVPGGRPGYGDRVARALLLRCRDGV